MIHSSSFFELLKTAQLPPRLFGCRLTLTEALSKTCSQKNDKCDVTQNGFFQLSHFFSFFLFVFLD